MTKKQKRVALPRKHVSWSQIQKFTSSPDQWYREYVLGEKPLTTLAMDFGKRMAEAAEKGESDDPDERLFIEKAVPAEEREKKMEGEIRTGAGKIKLIGLLDGYNPSEKEIIEYKTSSKLWTPRDVDTNGQITFYALLHYLSTQELPARIKLQCFETVKCPFTGQIRLSGRYRTMVATRSRGDVLEHWAKVLAIVKQMRDYLEMRYKNSV